MQIDTSSSYDPVGAETLAAIAPADNLNKWIFETIAPALQGRILEIGTGIGNISKYAVDRGMNITLSDINPEYRVYLQKKFGNSSQILSIDLQHSNFQNEYESLKGTFNTIFLLNVIEHLLDDDAAIRNCNHLLAENGNLIVLAPSYQFLFCNFDKGLGHYRRYTTKLLAGIINKQGFSISKTQYFNAMGISGWFFFGVILREKQLGRTNMKIFDKLVPLAKLTDRFILRKVGLSSIVFAKKSSS